MIFSEIITNFAPEIKTIVFCYEEIFLTDDYGFRFFAG